MFPWDVDSSTENTMRATLPSFPSSWQNLLDKAKDGQVVNHLWFDHARTTTNNSNRCAINISSLNIGQKMARKKIITEGNS